MSNYGLRVTGIGTAAFQIDSNTTSTQHMALVFSGTGTSVATNSGYTGGDILMARPVSGTGSLCIDQNTYPNFFQNADYRIFRASANAPTNLNGSTHGLTVTNDASPPIKIFDSRSFANSIPFTQIFGKTSFTGGNQPSQGTLNNTIVSAASQAIYDKTYVLMNGGYFTGTNTFIQGFYFDDTTNKILFESFVVINFMGIGTVSITNYSDIMTGELI